MDTTYNKLYTNKEQSLQLLSVGVPKGSADCFIGQDNKPHIINDAITQVLVSKKQYMPCWSVGALLIVLAKSAIKPPHGSMIFMHDEVNHIEHLVQCITLKASRKQLDFSRLKIS